MSSKSANDKIPPGFKLRHILRGHEDAINGIAWSPDGRTLASGSDDKTIRLWDTETGNLLRTLEVKGRIKAVLNVAWSPDGRTLASGSDDGTIRFWDTETGDLLRTLEGHTDYIFGVAWSPDGRTLASGSDDGTIRLWNTETGDLLRELKKPVSEAFRSVAWSPDGRTLASVSISADEALQLWDTETGNLCRTFHSRFVLSVAWSPDGRTLASGSDDKTIGLWDTETGQQTSILEGHTGSILCVSFSSDGHLLASKSADKTVRLWHCNSREMVAVLYEPTPGIFGGSTALASHPKAPVLATLGENDMVTRIWDLDLSVLLGEIPVSKSVQINFEVVAALPPRTVHYANAKVVLVGDTGVGKTGLALVLTGQPFVPTESSHGRHVWTFDSREVEIGGGRKETRETLLWDLAGQPGYRLVHQLHLNEVALALVVFDARSETEPFAGVHYWDRALRQAQRVRGDAAVPMKKFLVAARSDRGGIGGVSPARIESLMRDLGFDDYFETSAKEGWKIPELTAAIREAINWGTVPKVSSTDLFQRIKAFLIEEKKTGRLLSTVEDLYRTFLRTNNVLTETEDLRAQFETCIGLVESRDLIRKLSFGNLVLLQPELLDAYASAMVDAAKDEPDGLGSITEEDARAGRFRMPKDERIKDREQEKLLLIATIEDLLRHEIALREQADDGPHLVFPSRFTRENPDLPDPEGKAVTFSFEGPVLSVYATLAVRLSHCGVFKKKEMWKNAAAYTAMTGGTCGMFLREVKEGHGELTLFFDTVASEETRFQFEEYIHAHLRRRALPESIQRQRTFVCPECETPVTDLQVERRRGRGFDWIECNVCGEHVLLLDREERFTAARLSVVPEMDRAADARRDLDAGLVSAAAEIQTRSFKEWAGSAKTTVALVFTDVVGSTALGNEVGNEMMNDLRRAHFTHARRLIEKHGGHEIKTIGDSLMVAFRTAVDALNFVLTLHADTGHERIKIRAGIHVGLIHIEEDDAFGTMVNFTARVESQAKGDEIWVSDRVKTDVDEEKANAHKLLEWTEHPNCELKGFPGTHKLWSMVAPQ